MGLNNEIREISKSIVSEKQEKLKLKEQKEVFENQKTEIKQLLLLELIQLKKDNINIYNDNCKDLVIDNLIKSYISKLNPAFKSRFMQNYKNKIQQYMLLNYYTICGQAERIAKKQIENTNDIKNKIALEKWELQREKIRLDIEQKKQKIQQKQEQQEKAVKEAERQRKISIVLLILKIILAPFYFIGLLLIGFLWGMLK